MTQTTQGILNLPSSY